MLTVVTPAAGEAVGKEGVAAPAANDHRAEGAEESRRPVSSTDGRSPGGGSGSKRQRSEQRHRDRGPPSTAFLRETQEADPIGP